MSDDFEEYANVKRAPPVPMEIIRRVVAVVLKHLPRLQKVEDFLQRMGKSLYNGRSSYFDILMAVFPRDKKLKVSRAGFATEKDGIYAALVLSWAATCERWCAEYEELRQLHGASERNSVYAKTRSAAFATAAKAAAADNFDSTDMATGNDMDAILTQVAKEPIPKDDELVALTYQILWMRPFVWHSELGGSIADPTVYAEKALSGTYDDEWSLAFRNVVAEYKDAAAGTNDMMKDKAALSAVVYVDGVGMTARDVFIEAIKQLADESNEIFPGGGPRPRRGVCPAGSEFVVKSGGVVIRDKAVDAAVRAAIRKYGKIENVEVVCEVGDYTFDAVPLDEGALW